MNIGERIKNIREFREMTQNELGIAIGFDDKTARARISQYEINFRVPKEDTLCLIAKALNINIQAIKNYALDTPLDVMTYLFWLDEKMGRNGVELSETNASTPIEVHISDNEKTNIGLNISFDTLNDYLHEWCLQKGRLKKGEISSHEYFEWLIGWPDTSNIEKIK